VPAALAAAGFLLILAPGSTRAQELGALAADDVVSLLVRLGVNDRAARDWDGSVEVAGGELPGQEAGKIANPARHRRELASDDANPHSSAFKPPRSTRQ